MITRHARLLELIERKGSGYTNRSARVFVDGGGEIIVTLDEAEWNAVVEKDRATKLVMTIGVDCE